MPAHTRTSDGRRPARVSLGSWPTPIEHLPSLSGNGTEVWVKRDDRSSAVYGGNKVRKLELLLADALDRGATRVVTFGAAGSHHVLATTVHARSVGLQTAAVLVPQPRSEEAMRNLRCALAAGLQPIPVRAEWRAPFALARVLSARDRLILPGGSNVLGALGYVSAVEEIADAVLHHELPEPDLIVAALGSAGTVAGLLAGVVANRLHSTVMGVQVVDRAVPARWMALGLASAACARLGIDIAPWELSSRLVTERKWIGRGYAHAAPWGDVAAARAREAGLQLDGTYTAKAFADVLERVERGGAGHVLFVHTLSAVRPAQQSALPPELEALFTGEPVR